MSKKFPDFSWVEYKSIYTVDYDTLESVYIEGDPSSERYFNAKSQFGPQFFIVRCPLNRRASVVVWTERKINIYNILLLFRRIFQCVNVEYAIFLHLKEYLICSILLKWIWKSIFCVYLVRWPRHAVGWCHIRCIIVVMATQFWEHSTYVWWDGLRIPTLNNTGCSHGQQVVKGTRGCRTNDIRLQQ